jgi:hypothetical protein
MARATKRVNFFGDVNKSILWYLVMQMNWRLFCDGLDMITLLIDVNELYYNLFGDVNE